MQKFTVVLKKGSENSVYEIEAQDSHAAFLAAAKEDHNDDETFKEEDYSAVAVFAGYLECLYSDAW